MLLKSLFIKLYCLCGTEVWKLTMWTTRVNESSASFFNIFRKRPSRNEEDISSDLTGEIYLISICKQKRLQG